MCGCNANGDAMRMGVKDGSVNGKVNVMMMVQLTLGCLCHFHCCLFLSVLFLLNLTVL